MFNLFVAVALAADPPPAVSEPAVAPAPTGPDRSAAPAVVAPVLRDLPELAVYTVDGLTVRHLQVEGIRKVGVVFALEQGFVELQGRTTEELRAFEDLLGTTTEALDAAALATLLDVRDIGLETGVGTHSGRLWVTAPKDRAGEAMTLARDIAVGESFPSKDVKRWIRDRELYLQVTGPASQSAVASAALTYAWIPSDHPYGTRPHLSSVAMVKSKALVAQREAWLANAPTDLLVVGDLPWSAVEPLVKAAFGGLGRAGERARELSIPLPAATRVIAVDMPEQDQVAVRMRLPAPMRGDPDQMAAWALNVNLGGTFLSRLNSNLREEKGYTYGSRSTYKAGEASGSFSVSVDVPEQWLGSTLVEIEGELQELVDQGVTEGELSSAWRAAASDWNNTFANADTSTDFYWTSLQERLSVAESKARIGSVEALRAEDLRRVAARCFRSEVPRVWVLVGDRKAMEPQLDALGWKAQWVTPEEAFLGSF